MDVRKVALDAGALAVAVLVEGLVAYLRETLSLRLAAYIAGTGATLMVRPGARGDGGVCRR